MFFKEKFLIIQSIHEIRREGDSKGRPCDYMVLACIDFSSCEFGQVSASIENVQRRIIPHNKLLAFQNYLA